MTPPFRLPLEPIPGSGIEECFDYALRLARQLDLVVVFNFNGKDCGVRPRDYGEPERREYFLANYRSKDCKICYANPPTE